jgi:hypothetical protein
MDGHRPIDALNDSSLDREIASMLSAEPSPEFVARVRTRVAEEPAPGGWRLSWMFAAATAVAMVVVALIVWPSPDGTSSRGLTSSSPAPVEPARIAEAGPASAPAPVTPPPARTRTTVSAVAAVFEADRAIDIHLPDVVLGENEVKAYTALVSIVRRSRFDVAVPAAPDPSAPLEVKELPPVEPLEIEPLVKLATLE